MDKRSKVCVTGAAGYLGSDLVKKRFERGYIVHITTRNQGDTCKVGLLMGLPNAETRLRLFQTIRGCRIVVHMATPFIHDPQTTHIPASVVASLTMKEDGTGFKASMYESCWTPIDPYFVTSMCIQIAIVHIEDVREAHIFCMESSSINGRFYALMSIYHEQRLLIVCKITQISVLTKGKKGDVLSSTKLKELGFKYKHYINSILDGTFKHARKLGLTYLCMDTKRGKE
ncbi:hypothetical protein P3X46_003665 [Hevea brasiliensis]|uniref:NAD-dependent epimerase/dehydratase domain-containing protein n=1 Tax=Hevea brasiliensis TaxID=3981 RepID=A0ABQ9N8M5_HEVBR|nr:hypothetical protein P3X46_003665 [Hevea brasiliensis]